MYDYSDREVPCGTLPNGQTVPLTGRNGSIVRPRPKRAEGATTPLSPEIVQVKGVFYILRNQTRGGGFQMMK